MVYSQSERAGGANGSRKRVAERHTMFEEVRCRRPGRPALGGSPPGGGEAVLYDVFDDVGRR